MENYFFQNLESDKLNVFTTKEFYKHLDNEQKKNISSYCLFSRTQQCWISKAKNAHCGSLIDRLKALGFEDRGTQGVARSFAEQVEDEKSRAARRAERSKFKADAADKASETYYKQAKEMAGQIPFGQPILVGHHSEKRDRNFRDKIHNTFGKAFAEQEKAEQYREKAGMAAYDAAGGKYSNPKYLSNRIKESTATIRLLERRLEGKFYPWSVPQKISERERTFYTDRLGEEKEKLDFYISSMKKIHPDYEYVPDKRKGKQKKL